MKKVLKKDFTKIKNFLMFEGSLNQFDIAVLSNMNGYQIAPFILYQSKVPRLIKFTEGIINFENGNYEYFLYNWTNFIWILIFILTLLNIIFIIKKIN